jgi:4-amino-4-deoxy-L-arabinose transferase-like glycosyltransferase
VSETQQHPNAARAHAGDGASAARPRALAAGAAEARAEQAGAAETSLARGPAVSWTALAVVCIVALAVRLLWATTVHAIPVSDFSYYYTKAISLVHGLGYTTSGRVPTAFWPPGYPFFLAGVFRVFGVSLVAAKAANIVLWTVTAALAYVLGLRLGGRLTAVVAGLVVALFPEFIFYANLTASENLFVPLSLGALVAFSPAEKLAAPPSWKRAMIAGLLLGCAVLVRSTAVLVPALMALTLVVWFRSRAALISATVLLLSFAIALSPWLVRNATLMGAPVLSTNGGPSLWVGNNSYATGRIRLKGPYPKMDLSTPAKEVAANSLYTRLALTFIVTHPVEFVALIPGKLEGLFGENPQSLGWSTEYDNRGIGGGVGTRDLTRQERQAIRIARVRLRAGKPIWMQVLWVVGLIGIAFGAAQRKSVGVWLAVLVGYWLLFHVTLGNGQPRYLVSVAPAVAIGAAFALALAVDWVARQRVARSLPKTS